MSKNTVTVLFIADIVGKPGYEVLTTFLPSLKRKYNPDICIANGENGSQGKGLTEAIAKKYFTAGVNVITGGNHIWNIPQFRKHLTNNNFILRPANYPNSAPGKGATLHTTMTGVHIGVLNLQGRTFMYPIDCPFRRGKEEIEKLRRLTNIIFVDIHAEATAEKIALGWYFDGSVSAVVGTHTHVQTADERILPKGTAYLTDAGMTGANDSVIGLDTDLAVNRFLKGFPEKYRLATSNNRVNGVVVQVDPANGQAQKIERINLP